MQFNGLIPELSVSDIEQSKSFYIDILGFCLVYERTEDQFAFISFGEAQIMIEEINGHWKTGELQYPLGRGVNFQIGTEDVEILANKLKSHNIKLFRKLTESLYKCNGETIVEKELLVQDPDGYLLRFSQVIKI